jgi:hypothetical protein
MSNSKFHIKIYLLKIETKLKKQEKLKPLVGKISAQKNVNDVNLNSRNNHHSKNK